MSSPLAIVTGATRGLGRAVAHGLATDGWRLLVTARTQTDLDDVVAELAATTSATGVAGNVADPEHRSRLATAAAALGPVSLLVNNASTLGPSPLPRLATIDPADLADVLVVNVVAQVAVFRAVHDHFAAGATVVNVTSDAATNAWPGWGAYGASKAALEHASAVLAVEHPDLHVHAVDPGDLRTDMHQAAFPGEDISDRPLPDTVVPALLDLVGAREPSGRHVLADRSVPADAAASARGAA